MYGETFTVSRHTAQTTRELGIFKILNQCLTILILQITDIGTRPDSPYTPALAVC